MIYECPNCVAALIYNPTTGKMDCLGCGSSFDVDQFEEKEKKAETAQAAREQNTQNFGILEDDMMECNIYSCTACGAELAVNGVESSTFCAYCGQPTIVFNRVSSTKKPKYIIPFSISKDQAITSIRNRLSSGAFVPVEIQHFEIERVRGIYVPFWLYDIDYSDEQYLSGKVKSGKSTVTKYYFRSAKTTFHNLTLDASQQLSDESSQRLEPYNTQNITTFDTGYLSGFYADCFDMSSEQLKSLAIKRSMQMFNAQIEKSVKASDVKIIRNNPKINVTKAEYAMFPAWFLTFRYNDDPYTILVNGQTGKVVGAVPVNNKKATATFWLIGVIASFILTFVAYALLQIDDEDIQEFIVYGCIGGGFMWYSGINTLKKVKKSIELSKSSRMNHFVKDRQEG
ncbi:MAG: hypothetical protein IJD40_08950 [Lachnospiraceae bacterium]|nr:hypothetical protein [Lachnospiraceae bacterium]